MGTYLTPCPHGQPVVAILKALADDGLRLGFIVDSAARLERLAEVARARCRPASSPRSGRLYDPWNNWTTLTGSSEARHDRRAQVSANPAASRVIASYRVVMSAEEFIEAVERLQKT